MKLGELYASTCQAYGRQPNGGQADAWEAVLGQYPVSEVQQAVVAHQADTSNDDFDHRPRGSKLPLPADLKRIIEARRGAGPGVRFCGGRDCERGWVVAQETKDGRGVITKRAVKRCPECLRLWGQLKPVSASKDRKQKAAGE